MRLSLSPLFHHRILAATDSLSKKFLFVLGAFCALIVASQLSIPLSPVPLTFQSVTVLLIGMALGSRLGLSAILLYLGAGSLGLPVFANFSGGLAVFLGPTGGYLFAFIPAVMVTGYLAEQGLVRHVGWALLTGLIGTCLIFAGGVLWLMQWTHSAMQAIQLGVLPFVVSEPFKLIALALLAPRCWRQSIHN